jgi:membrane associated rhomboid family serine protease
MAVDSQRPDDATHSAQEARSPGVDRQRFEREYERAEAAWQIREQEKRLLAKSGFPITVITLAVLNAGAWAITEIAGGSTEGSILVRFGAQVNVAVVGGQYWRLLSSMFLHNGFMHLLVNCLALFFFGRIVELLYGRYRFLLIYLLSGYFGNLLFLAFGSPISIAAGASGAVFGILGAHIPLRRQLIQGKLFADRRKNIAGIGYVLFIFARSTGEGINVLAHLGGCLAGVILGLVLSPSYLREHSGEESHREGIGDQFPTVIGRAAGAGLVLLGLTGAVILGRSDMLTSHGKLLQFSGHHFYYASPVTEAEATRLGETLVQWGLEKPVVVQLRKAGDVYQFRMVVREGTEMTEENVAAFRQMATGVSGIVFGNAPVEMHICDQQLKTIKVVRP